MLITSVHNEHIKDLIKLKEKKYRDEANLVLIETKHLVLEAYKANLIQELILEKDELFPLDVNNVTYVTKQVLKKISSLDNPSNVMAVIKKPVPSEKIGEKILILDHIQDPGNLGTIIRSAVAFHIDTIIQSKDSVDIYNPKVIRASQGMMFHIPIKVEDLEPFVTSLRQKDYKIIGTKVTNGHDVRTSAIYSHFALIIGNEGQGMNKELDNLCDEYLYIRMSEVCESLNASVAASILLYEIDNK